MENNMITVKNTSGETLEVEILDIFGVEGYEDKEYVLYSAGEEVDENNEKVYLSIVTKTNEGYRFDNIEDEEEFKAVQKAVMQLEEEDNNE